MARSLRDEMREADLREPKILQAEIAKAHGAWRFRIGSRSQPGRASARFRAHGWRFVSRSKARDEGDTPLRPIPNRPTGLSRRALI